MTKFESNARGQRSFIAIRPTGTKGDNVFEYIYLPAWPSSKRFKDAAKKTRRSKLFVTCFKDDKMTATFDYIVADGSMEHITFY